MKSKLIILRGPSAAGKSTVAKALQRGSGRSILIIDQDYYRHTLLDNQPDEKGIVPELVYQNAMTALHAGYDVIIEGIFRKEKYKPMIERLFRDFGGETYLYYFAVGFEETTRRHKTRAKSALFSEKDMKAWFFMAEPLGMDTEYHIPQDSEEAVTAALIKNQTGL